MNFEDFKLIPPAKRSVSKMGVWDTVADPDYWTLEGAGKFGEEFNNVSREYWGSTGRTINPQDLMLAILIEDYNNQRT